MIALRPRLASPGAARALVAASLLTAAACGGGESADAPKTPGGDGEEPAPAAERVTVAEAWARVSLPPHEHAAAFLTLRNPGDADVRLVGVRSADAGVAELHTMSLDEESQRMRMRQVEEMVVPAGGRLVLEPGSDHLMFFELPDPWEDGETVAIFLEFGDGSVREMPAVPVRPL